MKKNILVTGGLGILGNRLIELLSLDKKNKVFLLDHNKNFKRLKKTNFKRNKNRHRLCKWSRLQIRAKTFKIIRRESI